MSGLSLFTCLIIDLMQLFELTRCKEEYKGIAFEVRTSILNKSKIAKR